MNDKNSSVIDWIIGEINAGRTVLVPVKLYDSIQDALQYNEIAPELRALVIARDVTASEAKEMRGGAHSYICDHCGGEAFEYDHLPAIGEPLHSDNAKFEDGSKPKTGDPFVCQKCKASIGFIRIENFKIKPKA